MPPGCQLRPECRSRKSSTASRGAALAISKSQLLRTGMALTCGQHLACTATATLPAVSKSALKRKPCIVLPSQCDQLMLVKQLNQISGAIRNCHAVSEALLRLYFTIPDKLLYDGFNFGTKRREILWITRPWLNKSTSSRMCHNWPGNGFVLDVRP